MTPEEQKQAMDFITASTARLAAAQEQDRFDRIESARQHEESLKQHEESLKRHEKLLAHIAETQRKVAELITWQSQRMDWLYKFYKDALKQNENFQNQALHLLNMILDRLAAPRPEAS
jgi:hypothetical protein